MTNRPTRFRGTPGNVIEVLVQPVTLEPRTDGEDMLGNKYFFDGIILDYFISNHGEKFRYVSSWGRWLTWDGRRWKVETTQLVKDILTGIARA